MKHDTQKCVLMTLFIIILSFLSCGKDSDLLLESIINEPEVAIEKNGFTERKSEEEGYVLRNFKISPINDAYLQDSKSYDVEIIRLQEKFRKSYLMFDLSKVEGTITEAVLQFSIDRDDGDGTVTIFKGNSNNWTEKNLNLNNAPEAEIQLGRLNRSYLVGDLQRIILDAQFIKSEETTFILTHSEGDDLAFASKEHPDDIGPKLSITYKAIEGSPLPDIDAIQEEENTDQPKTNTSENEYVVTTNGNSSNDGKSEASSWDIEHAFSMAKAGDVVHVKAGDYGNVRLIADNSGTVDKPISFIGYKNNPRDINSVDGPTFTYLDYKNNSDNLDSSQMPFLNGIRENEIGIGMGIEIRQENYIRIENFMISKYEYGIFNSKGDHNIFKNIITTDHGDFNPQNSWSLGNAPAFRNLKGTGIRVVSSNQIEILNSIAINNGARGLALVSSKNSRIVFSSAYSDNNTNPTDYYIMLYSTTESQVNNCHVERVGELAHFGHGFSVKVDAAFNEYNNCTTKGTGFELNNRIHNNTFTNCHVQGTGKALSGGWEITNYSHDNLFINCSNDSGEGIVFSDWPEDDGNNGINTAAFNNTFKNCTITNVVAHSGAPIDFHFNSQAGRLTSFARDNTFDGCTFSGAKYLFKVDRVNSGNKFINCTITDIENLRHSRLNENDLLELDVTFENTTTSNIGFSIPN